MACAQRDDQLAFRRDFDPRRRMRPTRRQRAVEPEFVPRTASDPMHDNLRQAKSTSTDDGLI
jgi:hypothetical protein